MNESPTEPAPEETDAESSDQALRSDIRRLATQLGDALVRQHGASLLDRVEQVRTVRSLSEDIVILGLLRNYETFPDFYREGGDIARLWEEHLSEKCLEDARCGDHAVWVTTRRGKGIEPPGMVDDERMRRLLDLEVDGVLVNDPALAMKVRQATLPASLT